MHSVSFLAVDDDSGEVTVTPGLRCHGVGCTLLTLNTPSTDSAQSRQVGLGPLGHEPTCCKSVATRLRTNNKQGFLSTITDMYCERTQTNRTASAGEATIQD